MLLASLGSTGMGLVWGWLLVLLSGRGRLQQPFLSYLLLGMVTALLALQVLWLTNWDWRMLTYFLGATVLALFVHLGWREDLRKRASPSRPL